MELLRGKLDLLLLATIARLPLHGYAIIADLRERSDGTFDLPEGSVYPALHRLERAGLIASESKLVDGRRRRTYHLTMTGHETLASQREEWRGFVRGVDAIVAGGAA